MILESQKKKVTSRAARDYIGDRDDGEMLFDWGDLTSPENVEFADKEVDMGAFEPNQELDNIEPPNYTDPELDSDLETPEQFADNYKNHLDTELKEMDPTKIVDHDTFEFYKNLVRSLRTPEMRDILKKKQSEEKDRVLNDAMTSMKLEDILYGELLLDTKERTGDGILSQVSSSGTISGQSPADIKRFISYAFRLILPEFESRIVGQRLELKSSKGFGSIEGLDEFVDSLLYSNPVIPMMSFSSLSSKLTYPTVIPANASDTGTDRIINNTLTSADCLKYLKDVLNEIYEALKIQIPALNAKYKKSFKSVFDKDYLVIHYSKIKNNVADRLNEVIFEDPDISGLSGVQILDAEETSVEYAAKLLILVQKKYGQASSLYSKGGSYTASEYYQEFMINSVFQSPVFARTTALQSLRNSFRSTDKETGKRVHYYMVKMSQFFKDTEEGVQNLTDHIEFSAVNNVVTGLFAGEVGKIPEPGELIENESTIRFVYTRIKELFPTDISPTIIKNQFSDKVFQILKREPPLPGDPSDTVSEITKTIPRYRLYWIMFTHYLQRDHRAILKKSGHKVRSDVKNSSRSNLSLNLSALAGGKYPYLATVSKAESLYKLYLSEFKKANSAKVKFPGQSKSQYSRSSDEYLIDSGREIDTKYVDDFYALNKEDNDDFDYEFNNVIDRYNFVIYRQKQLNIFNKDDKQIFARFLYDLSMMDGKSEELSTIDFVIFFLIKGIMRSSTNTQFVKETRAGFTKLINTLRLDVKTWSEKGSYTSTALVDPKSGEVIDPENLYQKGDPELNPKTRRKEIKGSIKAYNPGEGEPLYLADYTKRTQTRMIATTTKKSVAVDSYLGNVVFPALNSFIKDKTLGKSIPFEDPKTILSIELNPKLTEIDRYWILSELNRDGILAKYRYDIEKITISAKKLNKDAIDVKDLNITPPIKLFDISDPSIFSFLLDEESPGDQLSIEYNYKEYIDTGTSYYRPIAVLTNDKTKKKYKIVFDQKHNDIESVLRSAYQLTDKLLSLNADELNSLITGYSKLGDPNKGFYKRNNKTVNITHTFLDIDANSYALAIANESFSLKMRLIGVINE